MHGYTRKILKCLYAKKSNGVLVQEGEFNVHSINDS